MQMDRKYCCCFTGHRPEKIRTGTTDIIKALEFEIDRAIADGYMHFISGMSRGVDLWAAQIVITKKLQYPYLRLICAIPFERFEYSWSEQNRTLYRQVLDRSDGQVILNKAYSRSAYQQRNCYMVDHSSRVIAVYNGEKGGTQNTIRYANRSGVEVRMINA